MERTIVVGDVHGCRAELEALTKACGFGPGQRLVLVGDIVAKGPDSAGVMAFVRAQGALGVLGNHDAHVLRAREALSGKPEHRQVVETLSEEDLAYLQALPLYLDLGPEAPGDAPTFVVHAGAVPGIPIPQQDREHLLTLRSIRDDGLPTKKLKGKPWASLWQGPERLVFGHDAMRGLQQYPFAVGLDTGCVYGGALTALILPERRLVSVRAERAYVPL